MNDYLVRCGKTLLIVCITVCALGIANSLSKRPKFIYIPDPNYIPSAKEIQQRLTDLNDPRYDPNGIDGKIGQDSITAWDNYTMDRYAKRTVERRVKQ